ncbi:glucose 1-dehydrogenase [Roseateles sp.]|uniref:glucose 1-dehydrogenase n=1 Tax=Roseateles sp. TaxID=1971397 RepID=UPI00286C23B7|nr:glucose 1-dehydrogenase [Roseateles sp.]
MTDLKGRAAIVTGAASGIGAAIARGFVECGGRVVIADIAEEGGKALAKELGAAALFVRTDVGEQADLENAVTRCVESFGGLGIMVNNAGYAGVFGPIDGLDADGWDQTFRILLKGVFLGCRAAVPALRKAGGGCIINIGSGAGMRAGYGAHAYATAKAAVIHLTSSVALEVAPDNIRVNAISPGFMPTPLATSSLTGTPEEVAGKAKRMRDALIGPQPLKQMGQPQDIANAALFLASEQGKFVTGHNLVVDGGLMAGRAVEMQPAFFFGRRHG